MDDLDSKLVSDWVTRDAVIDDATWLALARRAVELLGSALGRELVLDTRRAPFLDDCVSVWAIEPRTPGPADVTVRAIVTAKVVNEKLGVDACIFFYVGGVRVGPRMARPPAPHRGSPLDYGELLHARLLAGADGEPRWEIGRWDQGFTEDEWAELERW